MSKYYDNDVIKYKKERRIMKSKPFLAALIRFLRVFVAIIIAGVVSLYGNSPYYLAIAPFLNAFSKWLRDAYGWDIGII